MQNVNLILRLCVFPTSQQLPGLNDRGLHLSMLMNVTFIFVFAFMSFFFMAVELQTKDDLNFQSPHT